MCVVCVCVCVCVCVWVVAVKAQEAAALEEEVRLQQVLCLGAV